jgi:hypothetical protein
VNAYKDYVRRNLNSQKLEALVTWEDRANLDLLQNRNEFVAKLNTNRIDSVYLSRLGMDSIQPFNTDTQSAILREQLTAQANLWSQAYQQGYQNGLTDFSHSVQVIDNYKTVVKQAIAGMMSSYQIELGKNYTMSEGCI